MNDLLHSFPGQQPDEPVFIFARPYWISFLPSAFTFVLVIIISLIFEALMYGGTLSLGSSTLVNSILVVGFFQLVALLVFFTAVLDFYYDIVIVTDRRVVDIDQEMLMLRRISQLNLEDVEDTTSISSGLVETIFNYGSVEIQTAGTARNFEIPNVLQYREIEEIVSDLADQAKNHVPADQRFPHTTPIAVVNHHAISDPSEMVSRGMMREEDRSRFV